MANEDFNVMNFPPSPPFLSTLSVPPPSPPPSPPLYFPTSSNSMAVYPPPHSPTSSNTMVVYYQGSGSIGFEFGNCVSMARPTSSGDQSDMATEEDLARHLKSPSPPPSSPPPSISMVPYYQGSGQSPMDKLLQNRLQRPANSGDQSDMATEEHLDVWNLPQWSPPPSPCSSANSMLVYQRSGQSSMDFVDRALYITGDLAFSPQRLLQFWMDESDKQGRRGGIMSMSLLENLPQSLECLGISLLHLYVEDEFYKLLYWPGESSWVQLRCYLGGVLVKWFGELKIFWVYGFRDLERKAHGQGMFGTERVTVGAWQIGPRQWVAKIRYRRQSLERPRYIDEWGRDCFGVNQRTAQVVLEGAQLDFPDLSQDFLHAVAVAAAQREYPDEDSVAQYFNSSLRIDGYEVYYDSFLNGGEVRVIEDEGIIPLGEILIAFLRRQILQVKEKGLKGAAKLLKVTQRELKRTCWANCINIWSPRNKHEKIEQSFPSGTVEAEIAEPQLNPVPSGKRKRKEKTPTGERENKKNKKTTRVKNVLDDWVAVLIAFMRMKILQVKKKGLKGAAKLLKVTRSRLKRSCRAYGINIWSPRNKHENIGQSFPSETPEVVEQEGILQSTFDTLPSDQALTATVDTNIVAEETLLLQFSPTFQQENPDEDSNNDEIEPVGMGVVGTGKEIVPLKEMHLKDAARELKAVDEEGSPQLINSDNLPSTQATAVTVDTNSVVGKEIPPLQFSRTAQQKNSDEAFGNDEVEEGEIWAKTTEENAIADSQFDSRCSAKRKRMEKNPRRERRDKKTTGVRIGTPLEDILETKGRSSLKDDANHRKGVEPTKFKWRARLRRREIKVDDTPSLEKQLKSVKGGASQSTCRGGFAESNVDGNTASGQTSSKKGSTSVIGKGEIKIKKPCSTEPTNETAFRSSLKGIITLIEELNLRTCHKEVLKKTPFWGIFEAIIENKLSPKQCRKSDKMIIKIINTYDPVAKIFRLGRESMKLTRADIVSIFGISCGNKFVDLKYCPKEKVKFVKRRQILEPRLTSKSLKQLLEKYLGSDENDDKEDVARLLCLYLFHTFLFPTGPTVKWVYLERIEDLDRLQDYDWNTAIINELMSSIEKYHREPRKVTGCVMVLLYWLCEHTNLSKADHREHPLGIVKWNIPLVVSGLKEIRLKDLKPSQVVSRQGNVSRTADDEVPVVQDSVSSGDVPVSNRGNDACSGNGKRDEKTQGRERVCRSKLKRVHRDYNIPTSPAREEQTLIGQSHPNESPAVVDQERIAQLNSDMLLPSNQNSGTSNTNSVTVRAKYKGVRIKFELSWPWQKLELEQEVKKRLQLDAATYYINYKDEDGEMTLIGCNEDLESYISSTSHQGTCLIDLFLEPK